MTTPAAAPGRLGAPDQILLMALMLAAAGLFWATGSLIVPYPEHAPWYESSALFPRLVLGVMAIGAIAEIVRRRRGSVQGSDESDELDSSQVDLKQAALLVALFMLYMGMIPWLGYASSTLVFLLLAGTALGLRLRQCLLLALPLTAGMWVVFVQLLQVAFGHGLLP